jgi:glutamine amidotransferase
MSRRTVGILDYGVSNLASVWRALHALNYRCRISRDRSVLDETDLLILPGVGAFPAAMAKLHQHDLVEYIRTQARAGKPIVGICLGMQLMADVSTEHRTTAGIGLIPGEVKRMANGHWHIGWNSIELVCDDRLFAPSDGQSVYFNHSYVFEVPQEYQVCVSRLEKPFAAVVRRGNIVGVQFHPEKSQIAGRRMLSNLIEGLCGA